MEFHFPEEERQKAEASAETDTRRQARHWLTAQGLRSIYADFGGVSEPEFAQLRSLIGYPAFGIWYSLLQHQRMEYLVELSNASLSSPAEVTRAAVLQGRIRALDQLRDLLLDIADPQTQQSQESKSG